MRWWGWGLDERAAPLPEAAEDLLREELGVHGPRRAAVALEDVSLSEPALPEAAAKALAAGVGADNVDRGAAERIFHAGGKGYPDLVRLRSGEGFSSPDAVVRPGSAGEVAAVLAACADHGVAVVPFGGGTSVVGGVEPVRDRFAATISLDLGRLDRVLHVDPVSLTATIEAGVLGPAAEKALSREGLTLGHFPQSFEFSTVGGWVATRSVGQASTGYGRIDQLVEGLRCISPAGEIRVRAAPASAAGPSLRELLVGSEGILGVICEATLRVRQRPQARRYEGWSFRSFEEGIETLRTMEQADASPDIARLSDAEESRLTLALASSGSTSEALARRYLRLRGHHGGCLMIAGFEGEAGWVERRRVRSAALLRGGGGIYLGRRPGLAWLRNRYTGPYLRDELLDRGVLVETLETATSWSGLLGLYRGVRDALLEVLGGRGTPPIVMCHVSHLYRSGASLYFTFLARQEHGAELDQWGVAKSAASEAIMAGGGTITHHHGVGRDHAPWMAGEVGDLGLELLRATKQALDPAGIMNPGKVLPR